MNVKCKNNNDKLLVICRLLLHFNILISVQQILLLMLIIYVLQYIININNSLLYVYVTLSLLVTRNLFLTNYCNIRSEKFDHSRFYLVCYRFSVKYIFKVFIAVR